MKFVLLMLFGLIVLFLLLIIIAKVIYAYKYKIRSEMGVQKAGYISIGGIKQYIQIRGQNASNPIIVMLHGGPGSNMASYSYYWQSALEKDYTIVHWDQRGSGNTYYFSKDTSKPTLDILLSDLDDLVQYICTEFCKEKVIIMGHSWGTFLGAIYSLKNAEKVAMYISISQMLDFKKTEKISAQEAIRLANIEGKYNDVQRINESMNTLLNYRNFSKSEAMGLINLRQLKERYLPIQYPKKMLTIRLFSPYMTFNDLRWMFSFNKLIEINSKLYEELLSGQKQSICDYGLHYRIPVIMIAGDRDWTTPHCMTSHYYENISAPNKKYVMIENAGHIPFLDDPKGFTESLLNAMHSLLN